MDSPQASHWRIHARGCPDCQTELFLIEALERQAQHQRHHLGREEASRLVAAARLYHGRRAAAAGVFRRWLWRAASLALLLGVAWQVNRTERVRRAIEEVPTPFLAQAADAAGGNYLVPLHPSYPDHERALRQMVSAPGVPTPLPASMPGFFLRERLLDIRQDVEQRRQELLELQERDLGDWDRDDVWEMVLPADVAVA
ncbi:MAG: hypothetical protein JXR77_09110 [Lentisphaeria bacterium]|nr:hypothetical protein [Lentisphaeria bacterium]